MSVIAVTQAQAELIRLAWRANAHPSAPPPDMVDAAAFAGLRSALRDRDLPGVRRALNALIRTPAGRDA